MVTFDWPVITPFLKVLYSICSGVLFIAGLNSFILGLIYLWNRKKIWSQPTPPAPAEWPAVTVQLPIYNEGAIVERLLQVMAGLDYPHEKLQLQILDDSTDSTSAKLKQLVQEYQQQGINMQYLHRADRAGYKAGNLMSGLPFATGEFVAVFDADFIPEPDWLRQVIPHFYTDPKVGFVQTRWTHQNFEQNLVTRIAGMALDGQFVLEQSARSAGGLFVGYNGSAGIFRRSCLDSVGGWKWDTLTEDVDMSFRTQLAGWRGVYLPKVTVSAELPFDMDAYVVQQFRWAKGTSQNFRKHFPKVLIADLPLNVKLVALMQLIAYISFPFLLLLFILALPVATFGGNFIALTWWTGLAGVGPAMTYVLGQLEHAKNKIRKILMLPLLLLLGVGISVDAGIGVISGFFRKGGVFVRTPKADQLAETVKRVRPNPYATLVLIAELVMAWYLYLSMWSLWPAHGPKLTLWLVASALGYLLMAGISITQRWVRGFLRIRQGIKKTLIKVNPSSKID